MLSNHPSTSSSVTRCFLIPLLVFTFVFSTVVFYADLFDGGQSVAMAQDDGGDAGGDTGGGNEGGNTSAKPRQTALGWLVNALGILYITVFLLLSFVLVAFFIMNVISARREAVCPQALIEGFEARLDEKQYQEAYELAKADESFLGNVLSSGLAKLSNSIHL